MVTIGTLASSEIMKHLDPEILEELTFEIASLGSIPPELKRQVLDEFQQMAQAKDFISFGGVDYARETLNKAVGVDKAAEILAKLESAIKETPFELVRRADPGQILGFIQDEHPQTIALVLAHLNPSVASMLLAALPEELQTDVIYRISNIRSPQRRDST